MKAKLVQKNAATTQLELDREAATMLSAVLEVTAKLNDKCKALSTQLQPLHELRSANRKSG